MHVVSLLVKIKEVNSWPWFLHKRKKSIWGWHLWYLHSLRLNFRPAYRIRSTFRHKRSPWVNVYSLTHFTPNEASPCV